MTSTTGTVTRSRRASPSAEWRIYYGDGSVVRGHTARDWADAPQDDVQVVVLMEPPGTPRWTYVVNGRPTTVRDRKLWTGLDEYDPFGWGVKYGAWMSREDYMRTWSRACSE